MKVRAILLSVALSLGLAAVSQAKTKPLVIGNARARAAARKNAKKQMKVRRKATKSAAAVRRPAGR